MTNLEAKPTRLLLFKNGVGLVEATADLPPFGGRYRIGPLPDATFGGFWLTGGNGRMLTDIRATQVMTADQTAVSIPDLIEANVGKNVQVRVGDKWRVVRIKAVPRRGDDGPSEARDYAASLWSGGAASSYSMPAPVRSDIVLLEEGDAVMALPMGQVQELRLPAENPAFKIERPRRVMEFQADGPAGPGNGPGTPVQLRYLTQGIAWMPSYTVDISREQAVVTSKAVIVNDLADLVDAQVELVTGYPNLQFTYAPDAFSLLPLNQILQRLRNRPREEAMNLTSNVLMQQSARSYAAEIPSGVGVTPVPGQASEDMSFRPLKGVTLNKGERGYYPLFAAPVAFEHLFTWDVPDLVFDERGQYGQAPPPTPPVWHALGLNNSTTQAWTTGAATVMKDGRILGQDTLSYTSPQCKTELRVTQALSIAPDATETEIERKRAAATFFNGVHDLVTIQGELSLVNLRDKPVNVRITKVVTGELMDGPNKPETTKLVRGLRTVNPRTQMQWKVEVAPGAEKAVKIVYKYQVYVRN
ncbi:MAG: hypothetical protein NTW19_15805 [Planctomycetota bacterium]|nr:hypothetical protein [Planctomycetota bacterium]